MIPVLALIVAAGWAIDRALRPRGSSAAPTKAEVVSAQGEAARAAARARSLYDAWGRGTDGR